MLNRRSGYFAIIELAYKSTYGFNDDPFKRFKPDQGASKNKHNFQSNKKKNNQKQAEDRDKKSHNFAQNNLSNFKDLNQNFIKKKHADQSSSVKKNQQKNPFQRFSSRLNENNKDKIQSLDRNGEYGDKRVESKLVRNQLSKRRFSQSHDAKKIDIELSQKKRQKNQLVDRIQIEIKQDQKESLSNQNTSNDYSVNEKNQKIYVIKRKNIKQKNPSNEEKVSQSIIEDGKPKQQINQPEKGSIKQEKWVLFEKMIKQFKENYNRQQFQKFSRFHKLHNELKGQQNKKENQYKLSFTKMNPNVKFGWLIFFGFCLVYVFKIKKQVQYVFQSSQTVQTHFIIESIANGHVNLVQIVELEQQLLLRDREGFKSTSYIVVRTLNGKYYKCSSNNEFNHLCLEKVKQYNEPLKWIGAERQRITVQSVKKIKKSNPILSFRSLLAIATLFFFIQALSKSAKNQGKGSLNNLNSKGKSHRFEKEINVKFKDVVGMQKSKEQIVQFIDFLKNPEKYHRLGARIPKGALLTGPPGTGKTMIAKACAGESSVPFFTISGSEFIQMYVGVGAQRVRNLFAEAKQNAPSIIFIDEIDAVGKKRSGGQGNDERDTTLNQLLIEMDGFDTKANVIVFAATNQKEVLDPALTRPGRFDRLIEVDLPDLEGRKEIFLVHLKPIQLQKDTDISNLAQRLARLTPGFSGADIKNVCNESAIIAARNNKKEVSIIEFQLATERIIGGVEKKSSLITTETKRIVAYHECGHGVVSWFTEHANPLLKLTIIPRSKGALGFAQYLPSEHQMHTKVKLMDEICVILGGRIAQEIFFNKISTGAGDDLKKAYAIAKSIVTQFGFGELGWMQYSQTEYTKEYSKNTENLIDQEMLKIMSQCTNKTRQIVLKHKQLIHSLAEKLLQKQTIDQNIIEEILGPRPFKMSKTHEQYLKEKRKILQKKQSSDVQSQTQSKADLIV